MLAIEAFLYEERNKPGGAQKPEAAERHPPLCFSCDCVSVPRVSNE